MALLYMLISALAFAGLDFLRKLLAGRIDALALVLFMSLGAAPLLAAVLLMRGLEAPAAGYLLPASGTLLLNFLGSLGFIHSVRLSPLSRTIPLLSLTPVFTALSAIALLGELPTKAQTAGILLVVSGAMALNAEGSLRGLRGLRGLQGLQGVSRGLLRDRGALLMIAVALMWAVAGPLDKLALAHATPLFHAAVMALGVGLGALLALQWQGRVSVLREGRGEWMLLVAMTVCISIALTFQFLAVRMVLVSLVEAFKRAVGSFMALAIGWLVFGERVGFREWTSVAVMVAGVYLILL